MREVLKHILKDKSLEYVVERYPTLRQLAAATEPELTQIPGIGKAKAKELQAIFQLNKQLLKNSDSPIISGPHDVYDYLRIMSTYEEERLVGLYLDTKHRVITQVTVSKGIVNAAFVHPREFFSPAVRVKATSAIVIHNHPTQNAEPSTEDVNITQRLVKAGDVLGIPLLDHIIIGGEDYVSLKQRGFM